MTTRRLVHSGVVVLLALLTGCASASSSGAKLSQDTHIGTKVFRASHTEEQSTHPPVETPPAIRPPVPPPVPGPPRTTPPVTSPVPVRTGPVESGTSARATSGAGGPLMAMLMMFLFLESDNPEAMRLQREEPSATVPVATPKPQLERLDAPGARQQGGATQAPGNAGQEKQAPGRSGGAALAPGFQKGGAVLEPGLDDKSERREMAASIRSQVETLRRGGTVRVKTIEEARTILEHMPELRPATEDRKMPNPDGWMKDGFADPNGTYRGDLINKKDPTAPVHPDVANPEHRDFPHYNIKLPNGKKAHIIIIGEQGAGAEGK